MDFIKFYVQKIKKDTFELKMDFCIYGIKDLMVRGRSFYAIWDEEKAIWLTDEGEVVRLISKELRKEYSKAQEEYYDQNLIVDDINEFKSKMWLYYKSFVQSIPDNWIELDSKLFFKNDNPKKEDYCSKKLPYALSRKNCKAYNELMSVLYTDEEREKIEWAIGAILTGNVLNTQKFLVLYGDSGTGKSTILKIIEKLFEGHHIVFDAKALSQPSNVFSTEQFKKTAHVAIQHDGDLSCINDNSKLNSIVSHEPIMVNEKFKAKYSIIPRCFIFMATNKPVKITDSKSGLIRRLIDVKPSGYIVVKHKYDSLMSQIQFELGSIANHCMSVFNKLGPSYYDNYVPWDMLYKTNVVFNFVRDNSDEFSTNEYTTLKRAYDMFKEYCSNYASDYTMRLSVFKDELKSYFKEFRERFWTGDKNLRSVYVGFLEENFVKKLKEINEFEENRPINKLQLNKQESIFDKLYADNKAQYATETGIPENKWDDVKTKLKDIDTSKTHYVMLKPSHIVIDFDLRDKKGEKSLERNLEESFKWPATYSELSKSGKGVHLHYIYDGDPSELSRVYDDGIEVKVFSGNSSLRRKLTLCNNSEIAHISSGLPIKEKINMINPAVMKSEKALRDLIIRNLNKEIHPGTKPSIDFIYKILTDAKDGGLKYDLNNMRNSVLAFANNSTNHADYCLKLVNKMPFQSDDVLENENIEDNKEPKIYPHEELVFFDTEVFPNLFIVVWKPYGEDKEPIKMINPSSSDIEQLLKMHLVGFNNRRYDNHILYARYLGYDNRQLYDLSKKIISSDLDVNSKGFFKEAFNLSYVDVYCFSVKKQSLKKFQIELGIHHQELGLKWDEEVPEELWNKVAEYCANDVISTELVFNNRQEDYRSRLILAELAEMPVNSTTNALSAKIVFGDDRDPELIFTDLETGEQF